ncbi:MAG TPA: hypothetical protein VNR11_08655 [Xanthobacteraceae bacterium]|nr:hypothetical protein [Xanthobacteraceae bacterium]
MRFSALLCAAIAALWTSSASAQVRITRDVGGLIDNYVDRYVALRGRGDHVLIDGPCLSACTLVVGLLPPNRVCATKKALLGFHAAWTPTANGGRAIVPSQTKRMLKIYPAALRGWIARNGGLKANMIFLQGRELNNVVRPCRDTEVSALR